MQSEITISLAKEFPGGHGECGEGIQSEICSRREDLKILKGFLRDHSVNPVPELAAEIIARTCEILGVRSEAEIWENATMRAAIGPETADRILLVRFKTRGPAKSTMWLNNKHIDRTLSRWREIAALQGVEFLNLPYQMIDFVAETTELAQLDPYRLHESGVKCWAVVVNTDVHTGMGKHWFCLFGTLGGKGTRTEPWEVEYFNSSGNPPRREIIEWVEALRHATLEKHKRTVVFKIVNNLQIQRSRTECGMWCLMYIRSRLEGHPPEWIGAHVNDSELIKYREEIFRD